MRGIKKKKVSEKQVPTNNGATAMLKTIMITPQKAKEFDELLDKNMPPFYCRMIADFLRTCPTAATPDF